MSGKKGRKRQQQQQSVAQGTSQPPTAPATKPAPPAPAAMPAAGVDAADMMSVELANGEEASLEESAAKMQVIGPEIGVVDGTRLPRCLEEMQQGFGG